MNKKISLGLCLSLVILAITATFAVTMVYSKQIYNKIIGSISQRSQTYDSVDEISRIISNYFYGTVEDYNALGGSLAEGYVNGLGDENSRYLTADEYSDYTQRLEGGLTGCGIETVYVNRQLVVACVYKGSPAAKEGIKKKDVIKKVNDIQVSRNNYSILQSAFYGSKLSTVSLEFERDGEIKTAAPMLGFSIPSVTGELVNNVGYVRISGFYRNTKSEFEETLDSLREDGAEAFVFDVRGTSEGSVDYACQVIDVVVSGQSNMAVCKDKNGNFYKDKRFTTDSAYVKESMAVLINSETKGPAELFASDLQNMSHAMLYGSKTAGNGTLQEIFTLDGGGAVLLTVALVEPSGGEAAVYNDVGIIPDVPVGDDSETSLLSHTEDAVLQAAVNALSSNG